jgi:hypothetical protein
MEADAGGEVAEEGAVAVRTEANVRGEVAEGGTVAANAELEEDGRIGGDDLAALHDRQLRLEEAAAEAPERRSDDDEAYQKFIAEEISATTAKGKLKVRFKRLGIASGTLTHQFNVAELHGLYILQTSKLATLDCLRARTNSRERRYICAVLEYIIF